MSVPKRPTLVPANPNFSSGPCSKRPGWSLEGLSGVALGRSHRAKVNKVKLKAIIDRTRDILEVPDNYRIGIVPASDTGAVELAIWSLLGPRGVDILAWESFGKGWAFDVIEQLKIKDVRVLEADYGKLPNLYDVDFSRDVVFTWNGTTSGVAVPDGDWIQSERAGLTICDATSAVFAMELPWDKLDATTYSWQKVMGGEAAHGMIVLGPRAAERLESYTPVWPMPKIFRLTRSGKLMENIFEGNTINTPSMLAVEDALDSLIWAEKIGGLSSLKARTNENMAAITSWVEGTDNFSFLADEARFRSCTSVCLVITASWFVELSVDMKVLKTKQLVTLLDDEGVAYDIGSYADAPPGLRLWAGATVETSDLKALFPWLEWGLNRVSIMSTVFREERSNA